jgi:hypothetical protein
MGSELAINADKKNAATLTYIIVERSLRVLGVFAVPKNIAGASVLPALPFLRYRIRGPSSQCRQRAPVAPQEDTRGCKPPAGFVILPPQFPGRPASLPLQIMLCAL